MNVPDDLRYSKDHEWAKVEGQVEGEAGPVRVRIGITDYAQEALGDVVFVQVPPVGTAVQVGDSFGEIESTKSVSDVYAPVSGTVVEVNESLSANPEQLNTDPYGDGWLCVVETTDPAAVAGLLDATAYRALTEG